jgi:hypothetical protein
LHTITLKVVNTCQTHSINIKAVGLCCSSSVLVFSKVAEATEGANVPKDSCPNAAQEQAMYALGFAEARSMLDHILDIQAHENDIA